MSQENLDLVRRTYAQWALGNMKAGVELFHPQIVFRELHARRQREGCRPGSRGGRSIHAGFLAQWRDYRLVGEDFRQVRSDQIVVSGHQSAMGRESGVAASDSMSSFWTFRDGKVVRLVFERDIEKALAVAGLRE
jgi:ketosteroid isomerase-like protein